MTPLRLRLRRDPDAAMAAWRRTRSPEALGALFDAAAPGLFRAALAICHDGARAEDAVQETFLVVLERAGEHDPSRPVLPWLTGILRNKVAMECRKDARRPDPVRLSVPAREAAAGDGREDGADASSVDAGEAIERLPEPYRSVALLRWRYGLTPGQIAHVRDEPPGTTRSVLARALARLRETLRGLPAAFLALGPRPARGLDVVRRDVLAAARGPVISGAAAGAGAGALGGILVNKVVAAVVVLAVALLGGFAALRGGSPDAPADLSRAPELVAAPPANGGAPPPPAPAAGLGGGAAAAPADRAEGRLRGRVVARDGAGVASARVIAYPDTTAEAIDGDAVPAGGGVATSDADGRFELPFHRRGPYLNVVARHDAYGPALVRGVRPDVEVVVTLDKSLALAGTVTDPDGTAIPAARVVLRGLLDVWRVERETTTLADGGFRIDGLPASRPDASSGLLAWLEVSAPDRASALVDLSGGAVRRGEPGSEANVRVVLHRGHVLEGRVLDGETSVPLPGARVALFATEGGVSFLRPSGVRMDNPFVPRVLAEATAGADGAFRFEHAPSVPTSGLPWFVPARDGAALLGRVTAAVDGYATASAEVAATKAANVDVELRLWPAATIEGRVVDGDGRPFAGVRVVADVVDRGEAPWARPRGGEESAEAARTGDDGRFRLHPVRAARGGPTSVTLHVAREAAGGEAAETAEAAVVARAGDTTQAGDVVLGGRRRTVVVTVVDETQAPVWGATVSASPGPFPDRTLRTDREGTARLVVRDVEPRVAVPLRVHAVGYAESRSEIPADADAARVLLGRGRALEGLVLDDRGEPVARARVVVRPDVAPPAFSVESLGSAWTGADGRFEIAHLPDGPWTVEASAGGTAGFPVPGGGAGLRTARRHGVPAGATDVRLRLDPVAVAKDGNGRVLGAPSFGPPGPPRPSGRAMLEVLVEDARTREPVTGARVVVRTAAGIVVATPVEGGLHRAGPFPAGPARIGVSAAGSAAEATKLDLPDEERTVRTTISLGDGAVLTGRVDAPTDLPPASLRVVVSAREDGDLLLARTVAVLPDGTYRADGLRSGAHDVSVQSTVANPPVLVVLAPSAVALRADASETRLDVVVVRGARLTVLPPMDDARFPRHPISGGEPESAERLAFAAKTVLEVVDARGAVVRTTTGVYRNAGSAEWPTAPGTYVVRLRAPGSPARERTVTVEAGVDQRVASP